MDNTLVRQIEMNKKDRRNQKLYRNIRYIAVILHSLSVLQLFFGLFYLLVPLSVSFEEQAYLDSKQWIIIDCFATAAIDFLLPSFTLFVIRTTWPQKLSANSVSKQTEQPTVTNGKLFALCAVNLLDIVILFFCQAVSPYAFRSILWSFTFTALCFLYVFYMLNFQWINAVNEHNFNEISSYVRQLGNYRDDTWEKMVMDMAAAE